MRVGRGSIAVLALVVGQLPWRYRVAAETLRIVLASPLVEEGSGPDGCTPALSGFGGPAVWEVRVERFLLDGKALVEASRVAEPNRFPLCIADRPVAKNAEVELPFVTHDGGSARAAGIVLRFADPQDFYVVEADALAGHVRLLQHRQRRTARDRRPRRPCSSSAKRRRSGVKAIDNRFAITLDGKHLFEATDGGPHRARAVSASGAGPTVSPASATSSSPFWIERL